MWVVIGGAASGGILVRTGPALTSPTLAKLEAGSRVLELECKGNRLRYRKVSGIGPEEGWVSLRLPQKELLRPDDVEEQQLPGGGPAAAAALTTAQDAEKSGRFARLALWPRGLLECAAPAGHSFARVCVFGAHHTCTNAMMRELQRYFHVSIRNEHRSDAPELWKHKVLTKTGLFGEDTFCVCLTKDPAFWIQSLARNPQQGTFYEVRPVVARKDLVEVVEPHSLQQLFSRVFFDQYLYRDALQLWETTVSSYFNEAVFPLAQTAVVRCEDFQFNFRAVFQALAKRGLNWRRDAPRELELQSHTAKDWTHPGCTRAPLNELLERYGNPENRHRGLDSWHVARVAGLDSKLIESLHYGRDAIASWTSPMDTGGTAIEGEPG